MNTPIHTARADAEADARIEALLSPQEEASIVDSLFAVAGGQAAVEARDVLDHVLSVRLQARLARRMREAIEQPKTSRSAA
ncbi:hypothetical protein [Nitratireductor sp. ZSWI3]|uniref:hypothetical protein n=1 Tax=Nitratireductor sp. ZSWI3 TaxID=2966359 RepID=UPI00214FF353|nr:hypothetical protein [Nitratireductor sp. ZSWI3]MCR4266176.1 hypothetical protein [Nitratireductor sp. ZSWI3]